MHLGTILLTEVALLATMTALLAAGWRQHPDVPGAFWWFASTAATTLAFALYYLDLGLGDALQRGSAVVFGRAGEMLLLQGVLSLAGGRLGWRLPSLILGPYFVAYLAIGGLAGPSHLSVTLTSLVVLATHVLTLRPLARMAGRVGKRGVALALGSQLLLVVAYAALAAYLWTGAVEARDVLRSGTVANLQFVVMLLLATRTLGLMQLTASQLSATLAARNRQLQSAKHDREAAESETRQLSALLPRCMACGKIRDDRGYWGRLDHWIQQHSALVLQTAECDGCRRTRDAAGPP